MTRGSIQLGTDPRLSKNANTCVVCSKVSLTRREEQRLEIDKDLEFKVDRSLKRLRRDFIDVLLLHNPSDGISWLNFDRSWLDDLKKKGKIHTYGVSNKSISGARNVLEGDFGTCVEWAFNILERRPIEELFQKSLSSAVNFIARSPLGRGIISSKNLKKESLDFDHNDFRSTLPRDWLQWSHDGIKKIEITTCGSIRLEQLVLSFCLSYEAVSVVIPGILKVEHIYDLLEASQRGALDRKTLSLLESNIEKCFPGWK